ncbi:UDP-N-acetylglucosamine transferase subunit ALG14 homolog [Tachysurus ichikawai]
MSSLSFPVLKTSTSQIHFSSPLTLQVLCNGPGTCIPLCTAGLLSGILGFKRVLLVYVESICRVESLSLSGKILYHFADYFFVQWKPLKAKYPKSIYIGRIV